MGRASGVAVLRALRDRRRVSADDGCQPVSKLRTACTWLRLHSAPSLYLAPPALGTWLCLPFFVLDKFRLPFVACPLSPAL